MNKIWTGPFYGVCYVRTDVTFLTVGNSPIIILRNSTL
jgi:hypothetical protein